MNESNEKSAILNGISEIQKEAVLYTKTPLLILAGAGSGKTLVITKKITYLIKELGIVPENILAVTFTNKAAFEMRERVLKEVKDIKYGRFWIKTFHSTCLKILRENISYTNYRKSFSVVDDSDKISAIKKVMKNIDLYIPESLTPKSVGKIISKAKNYKENPSDYINTLYENKEIIESIYNKYKEYMLTENAMDFDDLLLNTVELLEENNAVLNYYKNRWRYILVDEFQDTNPIQYKFIKLLTKENNNHLTVVGDDDQSIYAFRGAVVTNILCFKNDYNNAHIVKLEENYRCPKDIVEAALNVIKHNSNRHTKEVFSNKKQEHKIELFKCDSDLDEAREVVNEIERLFDRGVDAKDIVILFRTNSKSRVFEKEFMAHSIAYKVVGGLAFYERAEIKDSIAFLRLMTGFDDNISFRRVINTPPRSIGEKTLSLIEESAYYKGVRLFQAIDLLEESKITVKTINKIKDFKKLILKTGNKILESDDFIEDTFKRFLADIDYYSIFKADEAFRVVSAEENIKELFRAYYDYKAIEENGNIITFLEDIALTRDKSEDNEDTITLMTIHNAKGLEFNTVFITGLEMGVFPHYFSIEEDSVDEERRLCYVAITRARERLYLTHSERIKTMVGIEYKTPSIFLKEIPKKLIEVREIKNPNSSYINISEDDFHY